MTFIGKISKEHDSVKNVGGVTVLVLCTSSDDCSYLYNFMKIFSTVFKL